MYVRVQLSSPEEREELGFTVRGHICNFTGTNLAYNLTSKDTNRSRESVPLNVPQPLVSEKEREEKKKREGK